TESPSVLFLNIDKNECVTGDHSCSESQNCINTIGSFHCVCKEGYTGSNCSDINECSKDKGGCSHTCENTAPFYNCKCNDGYVLFTENGTMNRFIADGETGLRQGDVYHINHTCVPVTCGRPADVANGSIHSNRSVFYFEETVNFSCSLGWKLSGTSSLTCAADGNWSSSQP
ncbi:protein NEL-like, partial [Gigantopelta aegis]|uniref:protein NEL-like n=1 Tax=Gigantopelta aegis TaxID=1735272 RepID=UPI001B88B6DF